MSGWEALWGERREKGGKKILIDVADFPDCTECFLNTQMFLDNRIYVALIRNNTTKLWPFHSLLPLLLNQLAELPSLDLHENFHYSDMAMPLVSWCRTSPQLCGSLNHRITDLMITQSNRQAVPTVPTNPCPSVPRLHLSHLCMFAAYLQCWTLLPTDFSRLHYCCTKVQRGNSNWVWVRNGSSSGFQDFSDRHMTPHKEGGQMDNAAVKLPPHQVYPKFLLKTYLF